MPTPDDLKTALPAFADVEEASVLYWLGRAARIVDDSWPTEDGAHAQILLAAHLMTQQGLGTGAEAQAFANGASGFKRIKSGALELERSDSAGGDLDSTSYGRQFKPLLIATRGGPRVTGTGTIDYYGACLPW